MGIIRREFLPPWSLAVVGTVVAKFEDINANGWALNYRELDILMLGTVFPPYCSVTAKKSLRLMPFLGWFSGLHLSNCSRNITLIGLISIVALSGTVFIDRSNRSTAMAAFDGAAAHMQKDKQSVYIFPEGTRSYTSKPEMLPFKKGAFHLAVNAQVPIVPIVVANYSNVLHVQSRIFEAGSIPVKGGLLEMLRSF